MTHEFVRFASTNIAMVLPERPSAIRVICTGSLGRAAAGAEGSRAFVESALAKLAFVAAAFVALAVEALALVVLTFLPDR
jgi:hypothetical protein